jgi:hypothetical protein
LIIIKQKFEPKPLQPGAYRFMDGRIIYITKVWISSKDNLKYAAGFITALDDQSVDVFFDWSATETSLSIERALPNLALVEDIELLPGGLADMKMADIPSKLILSQKIKFINAIRNLQLSTGALSLADAKKICDMIRDDWKLYFTGHYGGGIKC